MFLIIINFLTELFWLKARVFMKFLVYIPECLYIVSTAVEHDGYFLFQCRLRQLNQPEVLPTRRRTCCVHISLNYILVKSLHVSISETLFLF